jgi:hypothetical protein
VSKSSRRRNRGPSASTATGASATGASATGASASGAQPRSTRRSEPRSAARPSFLERHRQLLLGGAAVLAIALLGGFFFVSAASPTYACSTEFQPSASADAVTLGSAQDDMGREHVQPGQFVRYTYCPPASGPHINQTGEGPIYARLYGPDDSVQPQGWVHNLEHGGLVLLYRCASGDAGCDPATQATLKSLVEEFPASPVCNVPRGAIGPIVARFDQMPAPYAAIVWGRVLYLDTLDTQRVLDFFAAEGERGNPEPQCAASPPPAGAPPPAASPSPDASASPGVSPSPGPSVAPDASPSPG